MSEIIFHRPVMKTEVFATLSPTFYIAETGDGVRSSLLFESTLPCKLRFDMSKR